MDDETTERDGTAGPAPAGLPKGPSEPREENIRVLDRRWWARAKSDDAGESSASDSDKPSYVRELEQRLAAKDDELRATITRYREANTEFEQARVRFRRDVAKDVERGRRAILA
ncbi:MAG: hypothetical protein NTY02_12060, partial [Acidobacteria bacterium]|nr:hypothetical protein [Acidobacteriota bacterium]